MPLLAIVGKLSPYDHGEETVDDSDTETEIHTENEHRQERHNKDRLGLKQDYNYRV